MTAPRAEGTALERDGDASTVEWLISRLVAGACGPEISIAAHDAALLAPANAALLALQRRIDRARQALDLGNTDRARRILEGNE